MENVVDLNNLGSTLDDAANTEPNTQQTEVQEQQASPEAQQPKQPGWIHQRIEDGVSKRLPEIEARLRQEYEQKYAPLQEYVLNAQAQELVSSGQIQDLEMAKEYVRMKNGGEIPQPQQESTQQRDSKGRFASQQEASQQPDTDPVVQARAQMLFDQAQRVQQRTGVDVMALYQSDPAIQARVASGEWDFYDVADNAGQYNAMPSPMRSPNGGAGGVIDIGSLSDKQFAQMQANIDKGVIYRPRQ